MFFSKNNVFFYLIFKINKIQYITNKNDYIFMFHQIINEIFFAFSRRSKRKNLDNCRRDN